MRIPLKAFQEQAVSDVVQKANLGLNGARAERTALVLAAPTGAGKTIMASAAIEALLRGGPDGPAHPDLAIIWLSDNPELNDQSRRKMLAMCSYLGAGDLLTIDASFDRERLMPGKVHFLNIQKLSKDARLVSQGDRRNYTVWETLNNTIQANPAGVVLIIDEAHRGAARTGAAQETIVKRFLDGWEECKAVPVVIGISATPDRFVAHAIRTGRTPRQTKVDVEDVRRSGLIKQTLLLHYPDRADDMALLTLALQKWRAMVDAWQAWCHASGDPAVKPLIVVQVEDGTDGVLSRTPLDAVVRTLEQAGIPGHAIAHSFQEGTSFEAAGHEVRYAAPPDIAGDASIQAVLFKTSLNTGWDCPRAEVMISFRTAQDSTAIAQLVGRMVRTPLAKTIGDVVLDSVHLFLPRYNRQSLDAVIQALAADAPIEIRAANDLAMGRVPEALHSEAEAIKRIPSYVVPIGVASAGQVRAMAVSRRLLFDGIDARAPATTAKALTTKVADLGAGAAARIEECVDRRRSVVVRSVGVAGAATIEGDEQEVGASQTALDRQFDEAGRKLREGLHLLLWKRFLAEGQEREAARRKVVCTAEIIDLARLDEQSHAVASELLERHQPAIQELEQEKQILYDGLRSRGRKAVSRPMFLPAALECVTTDPRVDDHLFRLPSGAWHSSLNNLETLVLAHARAQPGFKAWVRNEPRKPWSFCVPYSDAHGQQPVFPDFLVIRKVGTALQVEIWDPHNSLLADAPAKARGLAEYAARHGNVLGGVWLATDDGPRVRLLDLMAGPIRERILGVRTTEDLMAAYRDLGQLL